MSTVLEGPTTMSTKTLAFFGATGDCAGFCLAAALKENYDCIALARTPEKLSQSMTAKGVSQDALSSRLTIIKGDIRDIEAVKQVLVLNGKVVDTIISGIGCTGMLASPEVLLLPHKLTLLHRN
jgi:putative NADH-flavin reductase